jgi:hypothetical protein
MLLEDLTQRPREMINDPCQEPVGSLLGAWASGSNRDDDF